MAWLITDVPACRDSQADVVQLAAGQCAIRRLVLSIVNTGKASLAQNPNPFAASIPMQISFLLLKT